jgi:hypothetical protein
VNRRILPVQVFFGAPAGNLKTTRPNALIKQSLSKTATLIIFLLLIPLNGINQRSYQNLRFPPLSKTQANQAKECLKYPSGIGYLS